MFSKEFGANARATISNKYHIQLKHYALPRKFRSSHRRCSYKEGLQGPAQMCFLVDVAKFLKAPILKNISERLLLKISTSVTNLPKGGNS